MKLLMENKKKQMAYIGVMMACLGIMAWIWVPKLFPKTSVIDSAVIAEKMNLEASNIAGKTVPSDIPKASSVLPFGETFNTSIFDDARFKALVTPQPLTLSPEELGRDNPFLAPSADSQYFVSTSTATTTSVTQ